MFTIPFSLYELVLLMTELASYSRLLKEEKFVTPVTSTCKSDKALINLNSCKSLTWDMVRFQNNKPVWPFRFDSLKCISSNCVYITDVMVL